MQEFETARLMTDLLEEDGFKVERGIAGFPDRLLRDLRLRQPVVAIHTEYDSLPGQFAGLRRRRAEVHRRGRARPLRRPQRQRRGAGRERARGQAGDGKVRPERHAEGVRRPGRGAARQPALFRARRLVRRRRRRLPRPYRRRVLVELRAAAIGAGLGDFHLPWRNRARRHLALERPRRARRRRADGHAAWRNTASTCGPRCAHIASSPTAAISPTSIPRTATVWWFFRDGTAEGAMRLFEQAKKIAAGRGDDDQHDLRRRRAERRVAVARQPHASPSWSSAISRLVGMPAWTDEEHDVRARACRRRRRSRPKASSREIKPLKGEAVQRPSANDAGDVSWKVPMAKFYYPSNIPNINFHHWAAGAALATSIAHKGAVVGHQGIRGGGGRVLRQSGAGRGGQAHLQGRAWRHRIQVHAAGRAEAAGRRSIARSWKNSGRRCRSTI